MRLEVWIITLKNIDFFLNERKGLNHAFSNLVFIFQKDE